MAFIFLFIGMVCFGISNCLWRDLQLKYSNAKILMVRSVFTVTILASALLIFNEKLENYNAVTFYNFLSFTPCILISFLGLILFINSVKNQPSGISGSFVLWSILFGVLLAHILDHSPITTKFYLIFTVYIIGTLLIDENITNRFSLKKENFMALGAGVCWALASRGFKHGIVQTNPTAFAMFQEFVVFVCSFIFLVFQRKEVNIKISAQPFKDIFILALLTIGGILGSNLALKSSSLMYFTIISAIQPATTVFISKYIQKEEINNKQICGAVLLIVGAALV